MRHRRPPSETSTMSALALMQSSAICSQVRSVAVVFAQADGQACLLSQQADAAVGDLSSSASAAAFCTPVSTIAVPGVGLPGRSAPPSHRRRPHLRHLSLELVFGSCRGHIARAAGCPVSARGRSGHMSGTHRLCRSQESEGRSRRRGSDRRSPPSRSGCRPARSPGRRSVPGGRG